MYWSVWIKHPGGLILLHPQMPEVRHLRYLHPICTTHRSIRSCPHGCTGISASTHYGTLTVQRHWCMWVTSYKYCIHKAVQSTCVFTVQPLLSGCCSRAAAALAALLDCCWDDVVGDESNGKFGLMAAAPAMPAVVPWLPGKQWLGWEKSTLREEMLMEHQGLLSLQHRWTSGAGTWKLITLRMSMSCLWQ